ncbi:hypothetical protein [Nocardia carnea]|uniref:hypothetical protein n=1 Tax=Nocardia carnea TaxID=37328 RepID=UPI0024579FDD|nr:hypothetical protein [Nocardia carnea]
MGTPIALQGLWRTADTVETERLRRLHDALRTGPLGRRVVRSRVPGARDRWQLSSRAHPLDVSAAALPPEEVLAWADGRGTELDPERGPGWRLSAAPLTDGGTIVVLTCSHVLADARGLIFAVEAALSAAGNRTEEGGVEPGDAPAVAPDPGGDPDSDWADAAQTCATVLSGTARALWTRFVGEPPSAAAEPLGGDLPAGRPGDLPAGDAGDILGPRTAHLEADRHYPVRFDNNGRARGHPVTPGSEFPVPGIVLRCPAAEWERVGAAAGGTANSLFIWFVANTLWAAGFPEPRIIASLPVDTRDEPRIDNDLAMTEIALAPGDDPADIRAKSRAAYEHRMSSPGGLPEEFLHLVPDRVAYRLSRGAGERDILCSNIGAIPASLHSLGPHACTGVAARAIHPGLTYVRRPRTRMSGYLCRFRDDYLLTLVSLAPEYAADPTALERPAERIAERIGLPVMVW